MKKMILTAVVALATLTGPVYSDSNNYAARKAQQYLDYTPMSCSGLMKQLEFDGFTSSQAKYGAQQSDACSGTDIYAARKARQYLEYTPMSCSGLIKQLEFDGFTSSQAQNGAHQTDAC